MFYVLQVRNLEITYFFSVLKWQAFGLVFMIVYILPPCTWQAFGLSLCHNLNILPLPNQLIEFITDLGKEHIALNVRLEWDISVFAII